ncbi:hypothetical protein ABZ375_05985 [Streptomyces tibetensis]
MTAVHRFHRETVLGCLTHDGAEFLDRGRGGFTDGAGCDIGSVVPPALAPLIASRIITSDRGYPD